MSLQTIQDPNFEPPAPLTPEQILQTQKSGLRRSAAWAVGFAVIVFVAHGLLLFLSNFDFRFITHSIWFVFGALSLLVGLYWLYEASRLTIQDLIPTAQAVEFSRRYAATKPIFSYVLIGCFVLVFYFQLTRGIEQTAYAAGLVKPEVWRGEWWRLLTSATMHGGLIHIFFNSQAFHGFGKIIETVANRAHVAIVFLLSALGGSLASLYFMPDTAPSIGASGGILGLLGYLLVFGWRRKRDVPPTFQRNIIVNLVLIGAIGLLGAAFIDNAAHGGGLLAGVIYGFLTVPKQGSTKNESFGLVTMLGYLSLLTVIAAAAFAVWRMN